MVTGSDIEFLLLIKMYDNWMSMPKFWRGRQDNLAGVICQ